jgi:tetratricopeptide (TPR) repeat protein
LSSKEQVSNSSFFLTFLSTSRDFSTAIELYEQCLGINSKDPGTLAAIGFSYHQIGKMKEALDYYHRAHFLNNEDAMVEKLV